LVKIVVSILRDHNTVLTVSSLINDYHGISDVCLSLATIVNRTGVQEVLQLELDPADVEILRNSADVLKASMQLSNLT
jgi:L-lactate dehydrogenase